MYNVECHSTAGLGKKNEDYYDTKRYSDGSIIVALADGMGASDCARDAAVQAVNTIIECFEKGSEANKALAWAVEVANDRMAHDSFVRRCKMGCAIAVGYVCGDTLWYVSIGNVHIYLHLLCGSVECLTNDDVYKASNGNVFLSRSLSGKDLLNKVKVQEISIRNACKIVFATDGAYNKCEEDDQTEIVVYL